VAAALGDVPVAQQVLASHAAGPRDHGGRGAHGPVAVVDLEPEPVDGERGLHARERRGGLAPE
jgi:hypothetical protein